MNDILSLLETGSIQIKPKGYSMYPLFIPGRDYAIINKAEFSKLKRGDVILYRRVNSILVLHRICRITKNGIYTVGDNQTQVEGPLYETQVKGILTGIIRNGHEFSVRHPLYRFFSMLWLTLRPVRRPISLFVARLKKLGKYITSLKSGLTK